MKGKSVSIIIPVFNEEKNLNELAYELKNVMIKTPYSYEIIFVDDGSTDNSFKLIQSLTSSDKRIKLISFRKNFGQTAAISAGISFARNNIIVFLDADMQNDPNDIPRLLLKLEENYDIVCGWRKDRKDKVLKKIPSKIANKLISKLSGLEIHDIGCSLKACKKSILSEIKIYGEMHRYIPLLANNVGAKITEIEVNHNRRKNGVSKYGINRTHKVVIDFITISFIGFYGTKPNYIYGGVSFIFAFLGLISFLELVISKIFYKVDMTGNPFLLLFVFLFILSIMLFMMGLQADMLTKIYLQSENNKQYSIKHTENIDNE